MSSSRLPGADQRPVVAFTFEGRRIEARAGEIGRAHV